MCKLLTIKEIYYKIIMVGDNVKNGFTLVEFVSMMFIVSVMALVATPLVSKELNNVKKDEAIIKSNLVKQCLKNYYYSNSKATTLDLSNTEIINTLNIGDADIKEGQATIDGSGNITSEMKIDDFTCTISGNTEEISCS